MSGLDRLTEEALSGAAAETEDVEEKIKLALECPCVGMLYRMFV